MNEQILDIQSGGAFVSRADDPVVNPTPVQTPVDFSAQYPIPLDPNEFLAMCEEVSVLKEIKEQTTALQGITWRELNALAFATGSANEISFADGECPDEYQRDGTNTTVNLKNIGAKKSLTISDIMHSQAIASASTGLYGIGISNMVGGYPFGEGMSGGYDMATFQQEAVADLKEKEIRTATTLVMNGWDSMLVTGDAGSNTLQFDGIESILTDANGAHYNADSASGTFTAQDYNRFLASGCAKPTAIYGHGQAVQEMLSGFFQLGFAGSQLVNYEGGRTIDPGFTFGGFVNTSVGRMKVVSDRNFTTTQSGSGSFQSSLFSLRESHNGVPLVYRLTQIPLALKDLAPGCTAISFQVWAKTALIIKHKCAHGRYFSNFSGNIVQTCPVVG